MSKVLVFSPCGCVTLADVADAIGLPLIDSDKLPISEIGIYGILIDNLDFYTIDTIFSNKSNFLTYLNDVFKSDASLIGDFYTDGSLIDYNNLDDKTTIEVMAIYGSFQKVFVVGTPTDVLTLADSYKIAVGNGDTLTSSWLEDCEILDLKVMDQNMMPMEVVGYAHNPTDGTITLPSSFSNTYIFITKNQIPA